MSLLRQNAVVEEEEVLIRTLGLKLTKGHIIKGHAHSWGQVIFASHGVMQVDTKDCRWVVPPQRCLWMPAETDHEIRILTETWMRTIYVKPELSGNLHGVCKVLNVSPLLRELIVEIIGLRMLSKSETTDIHLANVLVDQLAAADEMSMKVTMPTDSRGLRLAQIISADPANRSTLKELSRLAGASPRTLERIFSSETGISVGRWRQQVRFMMAVRLLVEGNTVSQAAFTSGYESPSAFVVMFRRETGFTPAHYIRNLKSG